MEQVFFKFHEKQSNFFLRNFSSRTRSFIENTALVISVISFFVVAISHRTFVYRGIGVKSPSVPGNFYIPGGCLQSVENWKEDANVTHVVISSDKKSNREGSYAVTLGSAEPFCELGSESEMEHSCQTTHKVTPPKDEDIILSYSQSKGFLLLSKDVQEMHNISLQYIIVSKNDNNCFGEPFLQKLVFYVTGPTTVITNWFLALHDGDGYIYNPKTQQITDLHLYSAVINNITQSSSEPRHRIFMYKLSILVTSLFLFFMTTTLTSFVLHETQNRMLKFTVLLQTHVRNQIPYSKLICRHVVESLVFVPLMVGVLVFLMEFVFFGNTILGFGVLSLVWCGEVFSVICMRTRASIYFFPRIFFIYFTLFHVYFFSCPFGFSVTSLNATFIMLFHAMTFFLNRYEFPALQRGIVSAEVPRMFTIGGSSSTPSLRQEADNSQSPHHNQTINGISSSRSNEVVDRNQMLHAPLPPSGRSRSIENQRLSTSNANINTSFPSISNLSTASRGSPPSRLYGGGSSIVGSVRSSSPSGMQSYPSASMFYVDGEGEDDDSYGIFMNGEIVQHNSRQNIELTDGNRIAMGGGLRDSNTYFRHSTSIRQLANGHELISSNHLSGNSLSRRTTASSSSSLRGLARASNSNPNMTSINRRDMPHRDDVGLATSPSLTSELFWNFDRRPREGRNRND